MLEHHYPDVPLHGDFTTIGENDYGAIDLLVGGTPCQAFSVAGLRKGFADDRGNLTLSFLQLAARKKPRIILWENVPGVLSIDGGRAFASFLGGLAELGYGFAYRVLDAQYFGVPQRRRRVFVVGYFGSWQRAAAILFERESLYGDITPSRETGQIIAPTIRSGAQNGGKGHGARSADSKDELIVGTLGARSLRSVGAQDADVGHIIPHTAHSLSARYDSTEDGTDRNNDGSSNGLGIGKDGDPMPTLDTGCRHAVATGCFKGGQGAGAGGIGYDEHLSPTLSAADSGSNRTPALMTGMQVRRLTPIECERLQGFPDNYTRISNKTADGPRYKAIGNSMAVPVMRWLGERIKMVDGL